MNIRKLVKSGHTSLVIAVPQDWIKKNKLKPGDLLYITEKKNKLIITTDTNTTTLEKADVVISTQGKQDKEIQHDITSAYMNNFNHIIIKGKNLPKVVKSVKENINSHIALELVDESSERIVARSFLDIHDVDVKLVIRRMDNIIRSMIIDLKEVTKKEEDPTHIIDRDKEVNRLSGLLIKILKTAQQDKTILDTLNLTELDVLRYWEVNMLLEKIGDRVKIVANHSLELKKPQKKEFVDLLSSLEQFYKNAMTAFYQMSSSLAEEAWVEKNNLFNIIRKYIENHSRHIICSKIAATVTGMVTLTNHIVRVTRLLE